jgi:hypothetical protein
MYKCSDFRFLTQLTYAIPKKIFLKKVGIQINNLGDFGNKNDIVFNNVDKLPRYFYKNLFWFLLPKYHTEMFGIKIFHKNTYIYYARKLFKKIKFLFN